MKLKRVVIENFRCFDKLDFSLPEKNGLFLVTGRNNRDTNLGANGVGKSSLLEAISWCLYEKTSKDLKASKLLNRHTKAKGYSVTLHFDNMVIKRSWKPNLLTVDDVVVGNGKVESVIGLTFEQFLHAIYFYQNGDQFLDLTPGQKLVFLSDLFQLSRIDKAVEITKERTLHANVNLEKYTKELSIHSVDLERHDGYIAAATEKSNQWQLKHTEDIAYIKKEISAVVIPDPSVFQIIDISNAIIEIRAAERDTQTVMDSLRKKQIWLTGLKSGLQVQLDMSRQSIAQLGKSAGSICPSCAQTISADHVKAIGAETLKVAKQHKVELDGIICNLTETEQKIEKHAGLVEKLQTKRQKLIEQQQANEKSMESVEAATKALKYLNAHLKMAQDEKDPHADQIATYTQNKELLLSTMADLEQRKKQAEKQTELLDILLKEYPKFRLSVLEEVVAELEVSLNDAFSELGLDGWRVTLATSKELKSRDATRKELNMSVCDGTDTFDVDTLSGGERQRVKIACALGVSDLLRNKSGHTWSFRLFDEPTAPGLSLEGTTDLLEFLSQIGDNSQVWLLDHRIVDLAKFDGIWELVKNADGNSTLTQTE